MNESKIELTERLRREGRWPEASLFKDAELRKLRSEGMTKADAGDEAWRRMADKFPPLENPGNIVDEAPDAMAVESCTAQPANRIAPDVDVDALLDRIGDERQPADLTRDVLWVYGALENRRMKPSDAPSLGAWSLLLWARQYRNRFFEQILPKALTGRENEEKENWKHRHDKKLKEEIEGALQKLNESWAAELRADTPKTIREGVRGQLADWTSRNRLDVSDVARTDLEGHMGRFVQDCIEAIDRPEGVR